MLGKLEKKLFNDNDHNSLKFKIKYFKKITEFIPQICKISTSEKNLILII